METNMPTTQDSAANPDERGAWFGANLTGATIAPGTRVLGHFTMPGHERMMFDVTIEEMDAERGDRLQPTRRRTPLHCARRQYQGVGRATAQAPHGIPRVGRLTAPRHVLPNLRLDACTRRCRHHAFHVTLDDVRYQV